MCTLCIYHVWQAVGRILTSVQCQLRVCETEPFRPSSVLPAQPHVITERLLTFDESYHLGVCWLRHVHSVNLVTEIHKYYNETACNSSLVNTKTVVFWSVTSCSLTEDLARLIYGYDRALHVTPQKMITFAVSIATKFLVYRLAKSLFPAPNRRLKRCYPGRSGN